MDETIVFSCDMKKDELYNLYDQAINSLMVNIYTLAKDKKEIILSHVDRKNKNHLLILRVALIAKDIYDSPLKIKTGFWNWAILNWRMKKLTKRITREKNLDENVKIDELIDFMSPVLREVIGTDFEFGHIYDAFYKGELD
jgi:hypothetical protein